ncbi:MAG: type II toxin-antitoxin system PemK/MazF family toxin [Chloroflexota bacterium]|nr:type II toxin-antitoxin system PemK/MazF family toxin [Chloroflexota bacterium]
MRDAPRRGELWSVYTPGQPDDLNQPRPALIISTDARNQFSDDVIIIPIFSAGRVGPTRVALPAGAGGIRHDSILYCEEITTLDRVFLARGPFGPSVPESVLQRVLRAVRRALGEAVPEPRWRLSR